MQRGRPLALALALIALVAVRRTGGQSPAFYADDPLARVPESQDASHVVADETGLAYDMLLQSFGKPGDRRQTRALNVNTIDEVPDSSWFTNRIGSRPVAIAEIGRGPDRTSGPHPGRWTIVASKSDGITPGFTIRDEAGERWFIKVDPPGYPELATGAEVVSTKLFHALGYFVPENHVATVRREQLVPDPKALLKITADRHRLMKPGDVDVLLRAAERSPDGSYRVIASRALEGRPVGPFSYFGVRSDDPNDIVPHEHRRELRALRVFAAWTQHVDTKSGNTLDTIVTGNGRGLVRHHLIDLGSTLGSAGVKPRDYNEGHESLVELDELWRGILSFGFRVPAWRTIPYRETPSVGRFEGEHFDPEAWVPSIPNPAFLRAEPDDLFWGARRVAAFTDDHIRAAVAAGRYSDPATADEIARALITRRDRIARRWLPLVNPIVNPWLDRQGVLRFENAAVAAHVAHSPSDGYRGRWYAFDNATAQSRVLGSETAGAHEIPAPVPLPGASGAFVRVDVAASGRVPEAWRQPVRLYFKRVADDWVWVGLERRPLPQAPSSD
jgi:hypothetical protein